MVRMRLLIGFSKKFQEVDSRKLFMAKMFADSCPSIRNLKATEGEWPFAPSKRFMDSERRMTTVVEP